MMDIEFCIGPSPEDLGEPVVKTMLTKTKEPQSVECPAINGRYVLLRARSSFGGQPFASLAELGVIGE